MNKNIISIFGNSGVGKTTLANALVIELGPDLAAKTRADHYLKSRGKTPRDEFLVGSDLYDWQLLEEDCLALVNRDKLPV